MTTSRYTLQIEQLGRCTGAWRNHMVYAIYAQLNRSDDLASNVNIQRWAAGALSRLAAELNDEFTDERQDCGCPGICQLKAESLIVDRASLLGDDLCEQPAIQLVVRHDRAKEWLKTIKARINRINTADRWQPTHNDEHRWAHGAFDPPAEHYAPPAIPLATTEPAR